MVSEQSNFVSQQFSLSSKDVGSAPAGPIVGLETQNPLPFTANGMGLNFLRS